MSDFATLNTFFGDEWGKCLSFEMKTLWLAVFIKTFEGIWAYSRILVTVGKLGFSTVMTDNAL